MKKALVLLGLLWSISCSDSQNEEEVSTETENVGDTDTDSDINVDFCISLAECILGFCDDLSEEQTEICVDFCLSYAFADFLSYVQSASIYDTGSDNQCLYLASIYEEAPEDAQDENDFITNSCMAKSLTPNECATDYEENGPGQLDLWWDTIDDYCLPQCSI